MVTRFTAMSQGGDKLVLWGVPDRIPEDDPMAAYEGPLGAWPILISAKDGKTLNVLTLDSVRVFDGIGIGEGRVFMVTEEGRILCLGTAS